MKNFLFPRTSLLVILAFTLILSCQKDLEIQNKASNTDLKMLREFINSKDFTSKKLLMSADIDWQKSKVSYSDSDSSKPVITVVFSDSGKIIGSVEAIRKIGNTVVLPNENNYFMMYRDFKRFNFSDLSGNIEMIDLNYDSFKFGKLTYQNKICTRSSMTGLSQDLKIKYASVISYNKEVFAKKMTNARYVNPCDDNKNGDISYSECYKCMNTSCQSSADCYTLCYGVGDVLGWVWKPGYPMCQASIAISCIYISAKY